MRWHVRCGKSACRKRHSLLKHPDDYARGWKCRGCGGSRYTVVKDRNKDRGQVDCYCGAYVWPSSTGRYECLIHRRGSPSCHFNAVFRPGRITSLEPVGCIPGELDKAIDTEIERLKSESNK